MDFSTESRRIQGYLQPRVYMMFVAERHMKIRSESGLMNDVLAHRYNSLPESHQKELLSEYYRLEDAGLLK